VQGLNLYAAEPQTRSVIAKEVDMGLRKYVYGLLGHPSIYNIVQYLMGVGRSPKKFYDRFFKIAEGSVILDIGCGTANILEYLPSVKYYGFDIDERYIRYARRRFPDAVEFRCKTVEPADLDTLPGFDVVILIGVIHHLTNQEALEIFAFAKQALKPGGRLLTLDPCYSKRQGYVSKLLVSLDRGEYVRNDYEYVKLSGFVFKEIDHKVLHHAFPPYTHFLMECKN
jgi:SAM-dependent methyltransferase